VRVLALDWGTVRVGVAISDPEGKMAFPLDRPVKSSDAANEIKKICEQNQVEKILLGMPYKLDKGKGQSSDQVKAFQGKLEQKINLPVELLDERFSTVAAGRLLTEQGLSQKDQREIKDNIAAQIILQQYLDSNNKQQLNN
jgi:putative holliday junction resolvase